MRLLVYVKLLLFALGTVKTSINFTIESYIPLISDIRNYYKTSSVVFLHPPDDYGDYQDLRLNYIMLTWSHIFGKRGYSTLNVNYQRLVRASRYYRSIVRPLIIVLIPGMKELKQFSSVSSRFRMSFPTWFVIFLYFSDEEANEYCYNPPWNIFHIQFDTDMLVLCKNDTVIREWYSPGENRTETYEVGTWNEEEGFVLLTNMNFYDRRNNMHGVVLRAVTTKSTEFLSIKNGRMTGYFGRVLDELMRLLNFNITIQDTVDEYGIFNRTNGQWTGAIKELISGKADIGVADFSMSSSRVAILDYTLPLLLAKNCLYIKEPQMFDVQWTAYFQVFGRDIWVSAFLMILISPLLMVFIKTIRKRNVSENISRLLFDSYLYVWGILCQQGLTELPEYFSLKLAYFFIFCAAFVIYAAYSAALVCFLTVSVRVLPFTTFQGFIQNGKYKLLVIKGSSDYDFFYNAGEKFKTQIMPLMEDENKLPIVAPQGFKQVCEGGAAIYIADEVRKNLKLPCKVSSIDTGKIDSVSMVLTKNNEYTGIINYNLQKMLSSGILSRLHEAQSEQALDTPVIYNPVGLTSIVSLLATLVCGFVLGILILIIERIYFKFKFAAPKRLQYNKHRKF